MQIREKTTFHIVPMYNPDGVELELPRENANGLDLERQWDKDPMQPETAALKRRFEELMASPAPIEVAINMHSAYLCKRYFVYHDPNGNIDRVRVLEQRFIEAVRSFFLEGIEPWHYNVTWREGAPTHFPESFFWYTMARNVMALTYEDMNCVEAGQYDRTGVAIVRGIAEYLGISFSTGVARGSNLPVELHARTELSEPVQRLYDDPLLPAAKRACRDRALQHARREGRDARRRQPAGGERMTLRFNSGALPAGVYIYRLNAGGIVESRRLMIVRR